MLGIGNVPCKPGREKGLPVFSRIRHKIFTNRKMSGNCSKNRRTILIPLRYELHYFIDKHDPSVWRILSAFLKKAESTG